MVYLTREQWGAPALRDNALLTTSPANRYDFAVHWDGGQTPKTEADEIRLLKAYHAYHANQSRFPGRGGFPYNLAVGPVTGNVYEGRGLHRIAAAVGGRNTRTISVIVIGGPGNFTEAAKRGLQEAYALANAYAVRTLTQGVHSDFNATSCPGGEWRSWVKAGNLIAGGKLPDTGIPSGGGGSKYKPGDITVGGVSVKRVQERLLEHGFSVGKWGADGIMGDATIGGIRAFQESEGLVVDGIVGSVTWGHLQQAPKSKVKPEPAPAWPLGATQFIGPEGGPVESVSGHHGSRDVVRRFQSRLKARGWSISDDGLASFEGEQVPTASQTGKVTRSFQREKGLPATGLADARTWAAAWESPIT